MIVVGLTGSIGAGKSFVASVFAEYGAPVFDADETVHAMLARGGAGQAAVAGKFPDALDRHGGIDRDKLGKIVFSDPEDLKLLERILHPLVRRAAEDFIEAEKSRQTCPAMVLDVPLLFEAGMDDLCDAIITVTAPEMVRKERVLLNRSGMTQEKYRSIAARQWPESEKMLLSNWVVESTPDKNRDALRAEVRGIMTELESAADSY